MRDWSDFFLSHLKDYKTKKNFGQYMFSLSKVLAHMYCMHFLELPINKLIFFQKLNSSPHFNFFEMLCFIDFEFIIPAKFQ